MTKPRYHPFEKFSVGQSQTYGAYEVTEEEVVAFAKKYDPQPFHLDAQMAKHSLFGALCASGWHTCSMTMAMMVENMGDATSLGSPGIDKLRWLKPVYPGDILSVHSQITETRASKSKPIGFVMSDITVSNQQGEPVMTFKSTGIFPRNV